MSSDDRLKTVEDKNETLEDLLEALGIVALPDDWLEQGTVLAGRYRIEEQLGRGGASIVFRVRDLTLDDVVALKLLSTRTSAAALEKIRGVVKKLRRITHPGVVRLHDMGDHGSRRFVTMELVEGESLAAILARDRTLSPSRAAIIGAQVAGALEAAHAAGVAHLGLKPTNVIVASDWRVVVTDFGLARLLQAEAIEDAEPVMGRPLYLAPEQFGGETEDARTDAYSLGLLLFEMLTGSLPFPHGGFEETGAARMRWPAPDPRKGRGVPDALAEVVLSCLQIEPASRPASAAELRTALEASLGTGAPAGTSSPRPAVTTSQAPPRPLEERRLAVLPLVYRGPLENLALGEGLTEAVVDMLSRTRSLRVLAHGATSRFRKDRDLASIREALGREVDAVVDGTVQIAGTTCQVSARVVALDTGVQLWSRTFSEDLQDTLALQQSLSARIGEALRVDLQAAAHRDRVPPEAMDLYGKARQLVRYRISTDYEPAVDMLDRCLGLAADFAPAAALHAMATSRATWRMGGSGRAQRERAEASLGRALEMAPELAETHVAAAMALADKASYREAAEALAVALEMAPTCADAHVGLGQLQVRSGRPKEGLRRLRLALELDPGLAFGRLHLARHAALNGDREGYERHMIDLGSANDPKQMPILATRMRAALYFGDLDELGRLALEAEGVDGPHGVLAAQIGRYALGDTDLEAFDALAGYALEMIRNARMRGVVDQMLAEVHAKRRATDRALRAIDSCVAAGLVDVEWLRGCPALEPLRGHREYEAHLAAVDERARALWIK